MIIIGEKLNSSIPKTLELLDRKDAGAVRALAALQLAGGAEYLDVNAAMTESEKEMLVWVIKTVQEDSDAAFMVDSPNPEAVRFLYEQVQITKSIINSVTLEEDRLSGMLPMVRQFQTGVVAMPINVDGMPHDAEKRVENAEKLIRILRGEGIEDRRIYVDILAEAAGAAWDAPAQALRAARELRKNYPEVHLTAGLSNVSFGLPNRAVLNRAFLCCCMANGVDSAIMDPTNAQTMLTLHAADVMNGKDEYCMEYLNAYRQWEEP